VSETYKTATVNLAPRQRRRPDHHRESE
jgi:hypothetical protein